MYLVGWGARGPPLTHDAAEELHQSIGGSAHDCSAPSGQTTESCAALNEKLDDRNAANTVATVALGSAAVFGVATVATYLFWPGNRSHSHARPNVTVSPLSVAGGHGFQVLGRF